MYDMRRLLLKGGAGSLASLFGRLPLTALPAATITAAAASCTSPPSRPPDAVFTGEAYQPGLLLHIVLFKYKPEVPARQKREAQRRFLALRESPRGDSGSPYILSITSGRQNSLEGASQGYEQGFVVTFKSGGDRNYYVGKPIVRDPGCFDPRHEEFKAFVGPLLAEQGGALVFDYFVEAQAEMSGGFPEVYLARNGRDGG
ncbi:Dabb family protein [Achromobacter aloeverae]